MKPLLFSIAILLIGAANASAQTTPQLTAEDTVMLAKDTVTKLKSFSAVYNTGSIYLKWIVAGQRWDGVYVILRSSDSIHFDPIGCKKGVGVPIPNDIAYYFKDASPCGNRIYYKLLHISKVPDYLLSAEVVVGNVPDKVYWAKP